MQEGTRVLKALALGKGKYHGTAGGNAGTYIYYGRWTCTAQTMGARGCATSLRQLRQGAIRLLSMACDLGCPKRQ